jgi:hypothetical protein
MDTVAMIVGIALFIGPAVIILAISGEPLKRRILWAAATFAPVACVVVAASISEALGGPGLAVHSADVLTFLLFAALFGGWAVLIHYLKRQERHAS